jgi:signal transduction histidine kinase
LRANEYLSKNFVRSFSHELKTPLSSIKGYSELIADGNLTKEEIREYTDIIIGQIDRLTALSKSMLRLSLLDSSEIISKDETFRVDEQVRNVLLLTQLEWEEKNITFDLSLDEVSVIGNKQLTQQIWQNLISNAIKFSYDGGDIRIVLKKDEKLYFEIQDFGQGISDEDQNNIFNQFFTADKSRNKSGSGLGLSIVQKIIEKLGGEIWFESEAGKGSTFYVTLD